MLEEFEISNETTATKSSQLPGFNSETTSQAEERDFIPQKSTRTPISTKKSDFIYQLFQTILSQIHDDNE